MQDYWSIGNRTISRPRRNLRMKRNTPRPRAIDSVSFEEAVQLRFGAGVDVAVDQHEPVITFGTAPLGLQAQVEMGARRSVEGAFGLAAGTVVLQFLAHVDISDLAVI